MGLDIADRLSISELEALHGHLMDAGAFDRLDELFTDDVTYDLTAYGGQVLRGIPAVIAAAQALGDRNPLAHHVTNVRILDTDANGAVHVESKGLAVTTDGQAGSVTYRDTVVETSAGWRITARQVLPRRAPLTA